MQLVYLRSWQVFKWRKRFFLETAYESWFLKNPILSYRCLSELEWLNSEKVGGYLSALKDKGSIISKLILLFYWEIRGSNPAYKDLLADKELVALIAPGVVLIDMDEISMRLFQFENHISGIYYAEGLDNIGEDRFESIAKDYFKAYKRDEDAEGGHEDFLKIFGNSLFRLN